MLTSVIEHRAVADTDAPGRRAASAGQIVLQPGEGLSFEQEEGVRVSHPGFSPPNEPDCQVFREDGQTIYRIWWTTRNYDAQKETGENRWSNHVSISTDGLNFRYERGPEFRNGRITNRTDRDLLQLPDGRWRAYTLIGGGNPWYCIDSYISATGAKEWKWEPGIRVNFGREGEFDHTAARAAEAVLLPDGRTRIYYVGWNGPNGPYGKEPPPGERWRILSAISRDGIDFAKEPGLRIDANPMALPPHGAVAMSKPLVVRLSDGRWRMYFAARVDGNLEPYGSSALFTAVSDDGLTWQRGPQVQLTDSDGHPVGAAYPSLVRTDDGKLRLYYDGPNGIRSALAR